jgi:taurine--2-oxoglutarate transaminase
MVGDVRGKGLLWGVELVKDRGAKEPVAAFSRGGPSPTKEFLGGVLARGTYFMARYNVFLVAPPLVVAEDEIEEGARAVHGTLDDIAE